MFPQVRSKSMTGAGRNAPAYDGIANLAHVYEPARRTLTSYTGPLVRLRRSSDNAESDFGYVAETNELDTAAITTWLSGGSGYVVTIYDQKGTDNITQATANRQPLYNASAQNGHAGAVFDGSGSYAQSDYLRGVFTNGGDIEQPFTIYAIGQLATAEIDSGTRRQMICGTDQTANTPSLRKESTPTPDAWLMYAGNANLYDADADDDWNLWACIFNGASSYFYMNNANINSGNPGAGSLDGMFWGDLETVWTGNPWKGTIVSSVVVSAAADATARAAMQTAMNSYWAVYPF